MLGRGNISRVSSNHAIVDPSHPDQKSTINPLVIEAWVGFIASATHIGKGLMHFLPVLKYSLFESSNGSKQKQ